MEEREKKRRMRRKKRINPFFIVFCLMAVCGIGYGITVALPNFQTEPYYKHFPQWTEGQISIIVRDEPAETASSPIMEEGVLLFPAEFIEAYVDHAIFWDAGADKLIVTTKDKVIRMQTDELTYYVNDQPFEFNLPVYRVGDMAYVPVSTLEDLYHIDVQYSEELQIAMVDFLDEDRQPASVTKKTNLRFQPSKKSPIETKLQPGDTVMVYDVEGDYSRVRTADGLVGYMLTKHLQETQLIPAQVLFEPETKVAWEPTGGKINMVWDLIEQAAANRNQSKRIAHKGLDVISPTWFLIEDANGTVQNLADKDYVDWAHANGYQVWALLKNTFADREMTHAVLSDTDKREYVIKQILYLASLYDLDGINIDFESIPEADGIYYVQFIREIAPMFREQGLVVSVDVYVPAAHTRHYNREEVGKLVDYFMVMAYDEHWSTSPSSGPVASIGWVEEGIINTLAEVANEKVVMGLPFFVRVWEEKNVNGTLEVSSKAYGMNKGRELFEEKGVALEWDERSGSYYGEYAEGDSVFKIWLEDEESIALKLELVHKYNLAGVSGWRRGLEKDDVWDVIYDSLKN